METCYTGGGGGSVIGEIWIWDMEKEKLFAFYLCE